MTGTRPGAAESMALRDSASPMYCSASASEPALTKYALPFDDITLGKAPENVAPGSIFCKGCSKKLGIDIDGQSMKTSSFVMSWQILPDLGGSLRLLIQVIDALVHNANYLFHSYLY